MIKGLNVLLLVTCLVALVGVYALKYQTVDTANEKIAFERIIDKQKNDLSLLQADWAALKHPAHIDPIVQRHAEELGLADVRQAQFISIEDIPMRSGAPDSAALSALFRSLQSGVDPVSVLIEAAIQ